MCRRQSEIVFQITDRERISEVHVLLRSLQRYVKRNGSVPQFSINVRILIEGCVEIRLPNSELGCFN